MSRQNNITIVGNVGKDPKIFDANGNTIAKFSVAVYRSGKGDDKKTDWIPVTAWHDLARGIEKNIKKGDAVIVTGAFQVDSKKNDDGTWQHYFGLNVDYIGHQIFGIKKDEEGDDVPF